MAEEFWLIAYALGFFGSVSFGYLILRFGLPDIRTLPDQYKFGISGFLGVGIFIISFFASLAFSPLSLWAFLGGISIFSVLVIGLRNQFLAPKNVKVAIPVVKVEGIPKPTPEVEIEKPKVLERRVFREKKHKRKKKIPTEKPEIIPAEEKKEVEKVRGRERRVARRGRREEVIQARPPRPGILARRRRRYLKRRGELVEEAKTNMLKMKVPAVVSPEEELKIKEYKELGEGLDLSDLESIGSLEELAEVSDVDLEDLGEIDVSLESLAGLSETEKLPKEKGMGCPNCGSLKGTIVYCPYCGKGFCSDCSEKVKREKGMIIYECPHCGKEVIVKETKKSKARA